MEEAFLSLQISSAFYSSVLISMTLFSRAATSKWSRETDGSRLLFLTQNFTGKGAAVASLRNMSVMLLLLASLPLRSTRSASQPMILYRVCFADFNLVFVIKGNYNAKYIGIVHDIDFVV